jgi:hypothetical protein
MPATSFSPASPRFASLLRRWPVLLAGSIALHLLAFGWAKENLLPLPTPDEPPDVVTKVELLPAVPPAVVRQARMTPVRRIKPVTKAIAPPQAAPVVADSSDSAEATASATEAVTDIASQTAQTASITDAKPAADPRPDQHDSKPEQKAEASADPAAPAYQVDLPPPVELDYNVKQVPADGNAITGSGTITWQSTDGHYKVTGKAATGPFGVLTVLEFESEGTLDDYGIAPVLYSQKALTRSRTNTHFNRDARNSISFSATTASYPLKGGEQDRASIIWELAGIGRGSQEKFVPGAEIDLFVAGDRDGDLWHVTVIGQEEVDTGFGKILAWHVVRNPRVGTYDKKTEIWFAPRYQWYPVKILDTQKNGTYLDMTLSSRPQPLVANR